MRNLTSLVLARTLIVVLVTLSLVLTYVAIQAQVPYRFGGRGAREDVAADAFLHGTGVSAPLVFLIAFVGLLALTWLPGRWKALPLLLATLAAGIGLIAGIAEIALGSGPFAYPIGPVPVVLWLLSIASTVGIAVFGIVAAISAFRDSRGAEAA